MSVERSPVEKKLMKALAMAQSCQDDGAVRAPQVDSPAKVVAMGDPQTGTRRLLEGLAVHGLLGAEGWLRADVHLIVLGDYFDFGPALERRETGVDGLRNLAWLAAHSQDQVTLLAGNHDLARVGELLKVDDTSFEQAHEAACRLYPPACDGKEPALSAVQAFLKAFPHFPSVEVAARDLSSFLVEQRELVLRLLDEKRLRLASARGDFLFCHAGVTTTDLAMGGFSGSATPTAQELAAFLNRTLDEALAEWSRDEPFEIPGLHRPGSAERGEGGGILFHRPQIPEQSLEAFTGPQRRRYDPRLLPLGVIQVVGHIGDQKCRELLGPWVKDQAPGASGMLRHLKLGESGPEYRLGAGAWSPGHTGLLFVDGGMNRSSPAAYEYLHVGAGRAWSP